LRIRKWNSIVQRKSCIVNIKSHIINLLDQSKPFVLTLLKNYFDGLKVFFEIVLKTLILFFHSFNIREKTRFFFLELVCFLSQLNQLMKIFLFDKKLRSFIIERVIIKIIFFGRFLNFVKRVIVKFYAVVWDFIVIWKFVRIVLK